MISRKLHRAWIRFWIRHSGLHAVGRLATRLAAWGYPPSFGRLPLAAVHPRGYTAPTAQVSHRQFRRGPHVFLGERTVILQRDRGGPVELAEKVCVFDDTFIQTGEQGSVFIGARSHLHPHCYLSAFLAPIRIGHSVDIAANCSFFAHNHSVDAGRLIREQPLTTKGGIVLGDGVWLGFGVTVLDGVTIGDGAVIGAGSVVTKDIPANAIAVGSPARVVGMREAVADREEGTGGRPAAASTEHIPGS